jgi:hypothetical protein
MSCDACDKAQDDGVQAYIRIGKANVMMSGCEEHLMVLIERNRFAMDQEKKDERKPVWLLRH